MALSGTHNPPARVYHSSRCPAELLPSRLFGVEGKTGAGRRIRQILDLCPRIIEHNDCRFFLERNGDFETPEAFSIVFLTM
jgi:hypothetical protein